MACWRAGDLAGCVSERRGVGVRAGRAPGYVYSRAELLWSAAAIVAIAYASPIGSQSQATR